MPPVRESRVIEDQVAPRAVPRQRLVGSELLARWYNWRTRGNPTVSLVRNARLRAWKVAPDYRNALAVLDGAHR